MRTNQDDRAPRKITSVAEFCAEGERIGLTAADLAEALRKRPEFADCLPGNARVQAPSRRCAGCDVPNGCPEYCWRGPQGAGNAEYASWVIVPPGVTAGAPPFPGLKPAAGGAWEWRDKSEWQEGAPGVMGGQAPSTKGGA
jgi:hypothetical protein